MTNIHTINAIATQLGVHIPKSKGCTDYSVPRLLGHLSYWISLHEAGGKFTKTFFQAWVKKNHNEFLESLHIDFTEFFGAGFDLDNIVIELGV